MKGRNLRPNNRGMVSMMVTLIMMLVISMIVLGFAQVSRREQRQSLDRQLSTQAFLAAESGINDAVKAIQDHFGSGASLDKTNCDQNGQGPGSAYNTLPYDNTAKVYPVGSYTPGTTPAVAYTCLLVSTEMNDIKQQVSSNGDSSTIPIHAVGGTALQTLHIAWDVDPTQNPNPDPTTCQAQNRPLTFPTGSWPCDFGVLRIDMVPTDVGVLNRTDLLNNQQAFFLYPTNGGPSPQVIYGSDKGTVRRMKCTTGGCTVDITNIDPAFTTYALRVSSIYQDGTIDITASGTRGEDLKLADSQALIDSTGRAQDILRRVQVRVSLQTTNKVPSDALASGGSICKRFAVGSSSFSIPGDIQVQDNTNPMCVPQPGSPGNDAIIGTYCDTHVCTPGSGKDPTEAPIYTATFTNRSPISDPSTITGCSWSITPGIPQSQLSQLNNQNCNPGDSFPFTFPNPNPAWTTCQQILDNHAKTGYTVILTMHVRGSAPFDSQPKTVYVPSNC